MRGWLVTALRIAVTVAILGMFFWQLDFRSVARTLAAVSSSAIAAALLVMVAQSLLAALRLGLVVERFGVRFPLAELVRTTLEGMFFGQTFVSFLGGDALRIWRIRRFGLPLTDATAAVVLDRLIGICTNHLLLLATLPWLLVMLPDSSVKVALIVLALSGIGGFLLVLLIAAFDGRLDLRRRLSGTALASRVTTLVGEAATVGRHFFVRRRQLALICVVSCIVSAANAGVFVIVLTGMGIAPALALSCALLVPAILEIAMLPISIAGWGVREGAAVLGFAALGVPADQALGASLSYGLLTAAVSLLGGVLWLVDRRQIAEIQAGEKS